MKTHCVYRVFLLKDYNVIYDEVFATNLITARLMGWIWRYIPDLTFAHRRYMIFDGPDWRSVRGRVSDQRGGEAGPPSSATDSPAERDPNEVRETPNPNSPSTGITPKDR